MLSDYELVRKAQGGDRKAFRDLICRHGPAVYRILRDMGLDHDSSTQISQEVWASISKHINRIVHPEKFKGYLVRTTRRWAWRYFKQSGQPKGKKSQFEHSRQSKGKKSQSSGLDTNCIKVEPLDKFVLVDPHAGPEEAVERAQLYDLLYSCIQDIEKQHPSRAGALRLRLEGYSYDEINRRMGQNTKHWAGNQLRDGFAQLEKCMKQKLNPPKFK